MSDGDNSEDTHESVGSGLRGTIWVVESTRNVAIYSRSNESDVHVDEQELECAAEAVARCPLERQTGV